MVRLMLVVEYEGTRYSGFQRQRQLPSVQAEIERALERLHGESTPVSAAGRTDAGVHARGQVVSFRTRNARTPKTYVRGLNAMLPPDIVVRSAALVESDFDPRRRAASRSYRYVVWRGPTASPFWRRFSHHVWEPLDLEAMERACGRLVGMKDFSPFSGALEPGRSARRTLFEAHVRAKGDLLFFDFRGDAFLPHQVRLMTGTLLRVGRGRLSLQDFDHIIEGNGRRGPAVPPQGLFLMSVEYTRDWRTGDAFP
jgi:tRNA pseudouridine38-40 synthase